MPLDRHKKNIIVECIRNFKILTIFYQKPNGDRIRRDIEPYEIKEEKTKNGTKAFLYGHDVTITTPTDKKTIKKFDVERLGVVLAKNINFTPRYITEEVERQSRLIKLMGR